MARLRLLISDPVWLVSVVLVSFLMSLAAGYAEQVLDGLLSVFSTMFRARRAEARADLAREAEHLVVHASARLERHLTELLAWTSVLAFANLAATLLALDFLIRLTGSGTDNIVRFGVLLCMFMVLVLLRFAYRTSQLLAVCSAARPRTIQTEAVTLGPVATTLLPSPPVWAGLSGYRHRASSCR